ncbi:GNAT family N-acetyltransferase [Lachnobacterium bovis]|uniref:Acetyltransferase (GNAT) family protein n=1 Tax=Lachnobacterium bovis DSM 14045 TaxID=1122142 RepID=A0A1H3IMR1_9FIRM|nr:GNAT family N-acetyltransferase [Lachnobacterium bovis]SDY28990.1 Acetyltransferase (GNAT) family protein [Lachnobacterium bovis DSM 14045]
MKNNLEYRRATIDDLELLVKTRIEVLRAANKLDKSVDMSEVMQQSSEYYSKALVNGSHTAYLVFDGEKFIGAGGVSYYRVMSTYHNQTGEKAYIMNMYTLPEYRRQGIAFKTLDLLVKDAKKRDIVEISLEATDMGRALYEKYGFEKMKNEMELNK